MENQILVLPFQSFSQKYLNLRCFILAFWKYVMQPVREVGSGWGDHERHK